MCDGPFPDPSGGNYMKQQALPAAVGPWLYAQLSDPDPAASGRVSLKRKVGAMLLMVLFLLSVPLYWAANADASGGSDAPLATKSSNSGPGGGGDDDDDDDDATTDDAATTANGTT